MCKIAVIPHIPHTAVDATLRLARALTEPMTRHDKDAFGVAAVGRHSSEVYTARWLDPRDAWQDTPHRAPYSNLRTVDYTTQGGDMPAAPTALLLHARYATSAKGLNNAHPHTSIDGHMSLIHNGVVSPHNLKLKRTTCDSEGILNTLYDARVQDTPSKVRAALRKVQGYFALGVISLSTQGWTVDVIRDGQATLTYVDLPDLGTGIFCTTPEIVRAACVATSIRTGHIWEVRDNTHVRIHCETGSEIYSGVIDPPRRTTHTKTHRTTADAAIEAMWADDMMMLPR